jgi:hypothetical protein
MYLHVGIEKVDVPVGLFDNFQLPDDQLQQRGSILHFFIDTTQLEIIGTKIKMKNMGG